MGELKGRGSPLLYNIVNSSLRLLTALTIFNLCLQRHMPRSLTRFPRLLIFFVSLLRVYAVGDALSVQGTDAGGTNSYGEELILFGEGG